MAGIKIIDGMSNEEYHANEAVSKSRLDRIHKSIKHDQIPRSGPTPALLQGSAFHCAFLEREKFDKEYIVKKKFGLKKAEKEEKAIWEAEQEKAGRKILTQDQFDTVRYMVDALIAFPKTAKLFEDGKPEVSLFWDHVDIECKARPDWVTERKAEVGDRRYLIDLKSTLDASPDGFPRSVHKYRYHVQAAWYLRAAEKCYREEIADFIFLAVENHPPYNVGAYTLGMATLDEGWMTADQDLRKYKAWLNEPDQIPTGYSDSIEMIDIPNWGFTQI